MKRGYFQTPNYILELANFNIYQKMVLICLYRMGNQGASIYPSYRTIAKRCSISRTQAIHVVKELILCGVLNVKKRKKKSRNNTNVYTINSDVLEANYREVRKNHIEDNGNGTQSKPGSTEDTPRVVNNVYPIKNPSYKELNKKNHSAGDAKKSNVFSFQEYIEKFANEHDEEEIEVAGYYVSEYRDIVGREHRKMKLETWHKAIEEVLDLYTMDTGGPEYFERGETKNVVVLINGYFKKRDKFEKPCDFTLPHFNSPAIKGILLFECGL